MSIDIAILSKEGRERIYLIVGSTRDSSSSAEIWGAKGRVDWPPMSRIEMPAEREV